MMGGKDTENTIDGAVGKGDVFSSAVVPPHRIMSDCLAAHVVRGFYGLDLKPEVGNSATVVACSCTDIRKDS